MYFLVSDKKLRIEDLAGAPPFKKTMFSYFLILFRIIFAHLWMVAVMDNPFRKALVLFSKIRFQVHVKRVRSL
jgi:hypothetical protein